MSWLLPPAPVPWGSPSKAAKDPPLQGLGVGRVEGGAQLLEHLCANLLLELSLLLSDPRL